MDKQYYRKHHINIRRQMSLKEVNEKSMAIVNHLTYLDVFMHAENVYAYMNFKNEVNVYPLIEIVINRGHEYLVPKVIDDKKMVFSSIKGLKDLEVGCLGILEPMKTAGIKEPNAKDIMLLPGSCFDTEGHRIGYGGGYYDRYLSNHSKVIKVGIAFEHQIEEKIPSETYDVKVDYIVTENRILKMKTSTLK